MTTFSFIDLFSGAGGFAWGLSRVGGDPGSAAVDADADCAETLALNLPSARVLRKDVRDVAFDGLEPDVVVGGPPCQGFSKLNRGREDDPRNSLSAEVVRCVRTTRPRLVVIENVPAFLSAPEGVMTDRLLHDLGYAVRGQVVNCADFGVPQTRKRALLTASAPGFALPWPAQTHGAEKLPPHRTVGQALALLSVQPDGRNWHRDPDRDPEVHLERFRSVPEGGSRKDLPADLVLDCWKDVNGFSDVLGRLHWHRPATTVRTEFFRPEKGRFLHPRANRPITPREAARLQSFPDRFRFPEHQTLTSVGRQIGNAIPPALAEAIGRAVVQSLTSARPRGRRSRCAAAA